MASKIFFFLVFISTALLFPKNTLAANNISAGELIVEPATLHSLGFEWSVTGDDNRNAQVTIKYKKSADSAWKEAQPMLRNNGETVAYSDSSLRYVTPNLFAGSVLNLESATSYDVEFKMIDPDGGSTTKNINVSTKAELVEKANRTLHVYPPSYSGSKLTPSFTDVQSAYNQVQPGETILIHPGTYQKDLVFNKQATAANPITIKGADRETTILQGVGNTLINMGGSSYHIIDNLTLTDAGTLIYGEGTPSAQFIQIANNKMTNTGLAVRCLSTNCKGLTITNNIMTGWYTPQNWMIRTRQGNAAVYLGGQAHDVSYNKISLFWDGPSIVTGKPDFSGPINVAIDFYNNELFFMNDDCMQLDYGVYNIRAFRNFCHNSFMGISAQPTYGGPIYIYQNIVYNVQRNGLKLNVEPSGLIIINNTLANTTGFVSPLWSNGQVFNNLFLGADTPLDDSGRAIFTGTYTPLITELDYNGYRRNEIISAQAHSKYFWIANPNDSNSSNISSSTLSDFVNRTGFEQHGVELDYGVFENVSIPDRTNYTNTGQNQKFSLSASSAAINKGKFIANINDSYTGTAPDLGAYEFGQAPYTFGPRESGQSTPSSKSGDANSDNNVDGIDYVTWLNHFGQNVTGPSNGDFNNDSKVDGVDYVIWLNNFGK